MGLIQRKVGVLRIEGIYLLNISSSEYPNLIFIVSKLFRIQRQSSLSTEDGKDKELEERITKLENNLSNNDRNYFDNDLIIARIEKLERDSTFLVPKGIPTVSLYSTSLITLITLTVI